MSGNPLEIDIFKAAGYSGSGVPMGPNAGDFDGIDPYQPFVEWDTRRNETGPAEFMKYGKAPMNADVVEISGVDNIPQQYMCLPWEDESDRFVLPHMLAFALKEYDCIENTTVILTLPKLNQVLYESYHDFRKLVDDNDSITVNFDVLLKKYGEAALEMAHDKQKNGEKVQNPELEKFFKMSTEDFYCWLTKYGIMSRISYLGVINNVSRAISLENIHQTGQYTTVNVVMGKRCEVANVFGDVDHVTSGSRLWLILRRKSTIKNGNVEYREFHVVPHGCRYKDFPRQLDLQYIDPSGRYFRGEKWTIGKVLTPGSFSPQKGQMESASNCGLFCNERSAYETHLGLPTMYIAAGFK